MFLVHSFLPLQFILLNCITWSGRGTEGHIQLCCIIWKPITKSLFGRSSCSVSFLRSLLPSGPGLPSATEGWDRAPTPFFHSCFSLAFFHFFPHPSTMWVILSHLLGNFLFWGKGVTKFQKKLLYLEQCLRMLKIHWGICNLVLILAPKFCEIVMSPWTLISSSVCQHIWSVMGLRYPAAGLPVPLTFSLLAPYATSQHLICGKQQSRLFTLHIQTQPQKSMHTVYQCPVVLKETHCYLETAPRYVSPNQKQAWV